MNRKSRAQALHQHLARYLALIAAGETPEQAWHREFEHLHPIMQARLRKLIALLPTT